MTDQHRTFVASEAEAGDRLDRVLSLRFDDISRSRFKELVKAGRVNINGAVVIEPNFRIAPDQEIAVVVPAPEPAIPQPESIPLDIVFEDADLIVIDKPAGLVIHPAAGNWTGTLVNALIAHCGDSLSGIGGVRRPGIVHRLDKDTTGLLVVAKNDRAHQGLSDQFAAHGRDGRLERAYLALVWGGLDRKSGTIDAALERKATNRQKMAVSTRGGKHAVTHYKVLSSFGGEGNKTLASLVECRLETGRTHQIRAHMAHIGHPALGDATYGSGFAASARNLTEDAASALAVLKRQALHAYKLGFEHPVSAEALKFESPLPVDIQALLTALKTG